jgi:hypothetical protein
MDSATRHWRFLNNGEFDVAEVSASSYLAARDNDLPFRAIPVFLHRRFRHGFMFINTSKGIRTPADLKGRRIGVKTMMTTAVLWMRGILQSEYGVPLSSIEWVAEIEDDVKVALPPDIRYSCPPNDKSVETMLAEGELDAVFHSDFVKPFLAKDPRVARLFPDHKAEEMAYFRRTGIFPIMHVLGLRKTLADAHPWLAVNLFRAFSEAKTMAMNPASLLASRMPCFQTFSCACAPVRPSARMAANANVRLCTDESSRFGGFVWPEATVLLSRPQLGFAGRSSHSAHSRESGNPVLNAWVPAFAGTSGAKSATGA